VTISLVELNEEKALFVAWRDITESKRQKEEFKIVFETSKDGLAILDLESNFISFNESYLAMTGYTRNELLQKSCIGMSIPKDVSRAKEALAEVLNNGSITNFEKSCIRKDGSVITINMSIALMPDKNHILISTKDVTESKNHERQLEYIAHYDSLTKLPNRILNSDRLRQAMIHTERRNEKIAVLFLDLDGFKEVNDRYGHSAGDMLLVALSTNMKQADTLSRLGGDEFVAIIVDLDDTSSALPIIQRLLDFTSQAIELGNIVVQVSASIGVTFYPQHKDVDADQLIRQADQAMYIAKQSGKNRYHIFDPESE
jgi:diguanylate cyclase (GGDEF)-like protein/PAS domain S-box-containing protein